MDKQYLKYCIGRKGYTQRDLAKYLEISAVALNKKMNEKAGWSIEDIRKTKCFLGLNDKEVLEIWEI